MAYIRKRKKSYSVVYRVNDADGTEHQKSEGYTTLKEAEKRKKEIEYKQSLGTFVVPKCTKVKELIKEYVRIYGHNEWGVATYDGNIGLINNYIIPTIGEVQLSEINNHFIRQNSSLKYGTCFQSESSGIHFSSTAHIQSVC